MKRPFLVLLLIILAAFWWGGQPALAMDCSGCCTDDHCADCYIALPDKSEALTSQKTAELNDSPVLLVTENVLPKPAIKCVNLVPELKECCFAVDKRGHPSLGPPQV